ncbi:hypothetical protein PT2222_180126 [Paraburkholderia tropica]
MIVFVDNLTEKFNALLTFLTAMGIVVDPQLKSFLTVNKQWITNLHNKPLRSLN